MYKILQSLLIGMVLYLVGCSENIHFRGNVTYSDDGSPLTTGTVCFATDTFLARGYLKSDGSYMLGSLNERDGIPPGTYRVYIIDAETSIDVDKDGTPVMKQLVGKKYTNPMTSGLTTEVSESIKHFDFSIERP